MKKNHFYFIIIYFVLFVTLIFQMYNGYDPNIASVSNETDQYSNLDGEDDGIGESFRNFVTATQISTHQIAIYLSSKDRASDADYDESYNEGGGIDWGRPSNSSSTSLSSNNVYDTRRGGQNNSGGDYGSNGGLAVNSFGGLGPNMLGLSNSKHDRRVEDDAKIGNSQARFNSVGGLGSDASGGGDIILAPPPPDNVPLDNWSIVLILAGLILGSYKLKSLRNIA